MAKYPRRFMPDAESQRCHPNGYLELLSPDDVAYMVTPHWRERRYWMTEKWLVANRCEITSAEATDKDAGGMYVSEHHFTCPMCGGHHFGTRTAKSVEHGMVTLDRVNCHDEREVGCRWSGIWPLTAESPKIDHELAALRKLAGEAR